MTPESRIHLGVLGLSALLAVRWVGSSPPSAPVASHSFSPARAQPQEPVTRAGLRAQISKLDAAIEAQHRRGGPTENAIWELRALGYARIARGPQHQRMTHLLASQTEIRASNTIASLLESGMSPDRVIPFSQNRLTLRQWLDSLLEGKPTPNESKPSDAHRIELLTFAVLSGEHARTSELGALTRSALLELESRYRALEGGVGKGRRSQSLSQFETWKTNSATEQEGNLQLSSAALRATAVLRDRPLSAVARRHIRALTYRTDQETRLLTRRLGPRPRLQNRASMLESIETLGRLGQALHAATLNYPNSKPSPPAALARAIVQVATSLSTSLNSLTPPLLSGARPESVAHELRAGAIALRSLRTARIAIRD